MQNSREVKINLIGKPRVDFATNFVKWTFNAGRIIIATTELVVLFALGYRFYLDRKIIDLHDQIKNNKRLVEIQAPKEAKYISIQNRLSIIKKTELNTDIKIKIMGNILDLISRGDFVSSNLTVDQNSVHLDGIAFSIFTINSFIDDLKKNEDVTSISLDDFSSGQDGIHFSLAIELKTDKK